jgi:hypothetical protein
LEILYPKISVHVRGIGIKGTRYKYRYKYRYRYEVQVQVRVRGIGTGTGTRYVRGTSTRYRYRYREQIRFGRVVIPNLTLPGNPDSKLIVVTEIEIQFVFLDESRKLPRIQQYDLAVHVVI